MSVLLMRIPVVAVVAAVAVAAAVHAQPSQVQADRWAPLQVLLGDWEGTSEGRPGTAKVRRQYRLILGDRFMEARNTSTYPPQEKNPKGEMHEDVGIFSYDTARRRFVLRQFHVEGFVNEYVAEEGPSGGRLVFTTESIENIPAGWRARETYVLTGADAFEEIFELAGPGKDFEVYSHARFKRSR